MLAFGLAMALGIFLAIAAGRLLFKPETLDGLLQAVSGGSPHWGGRPDGAPTARRPRLTARYTLWCVPIVGVEMPPEPQPDLRAGMTPEMAFAAMTMAEGTA